MVVKMSRSQDIVNKCLAIAFDKSVGEAEASTAFNRARQLIKNGKGQVALGKTIYVDKVITKSVSCGRPKEGRATIDITCKALKMWYIIHYITEYAYDEDIAIKFIVKGSADRPKVTMIYEGTDKQLDIIGKMIDKIYNKEI
jgi:hypothetical protein